MCLLLATATVVLLAISCSCPVLIKPVTGACLFCFYLLDVGATAIADMHQHTSLHA
jgi:hypothetical protein